MKRICIAISSNDKDTTMHLEIYAPEYKGDLKGLIQICHGMTEYMGRYVEFAKYFTSRGYIVFGNDIISHGHSTTPRSSCLYINDWNDTVKDMVSAREYVVRKYPDLPIYYIFFDRCIHRAPYFFISLRVSFQLFVSSLITFSSLPPICSNTNLTFVHDISLK